MKCSNLEQFCKFCSRNRSSFYIFDVEMHGAQGFNVLASSADHSGRVSDALSLVLCLIISFNNVGIISDINFRMK